MTPSTLLRTYAAALLIIAVGLLDLAPAPARAQEKGRSPSTSILSNRSSPEQPRWQQLRSASTGIPLEGAVDPATYEVGPGDVFSIFVGGPQPISLTPAVSAEGDLTLPEVGSLPVAERTLADVRKAARSALRKRFENVTLEVSLMRPRHFYVHVTGAVPAAGRYLANPVARVSNVVGMAFTDTARAAVGNPTFKPSFRNITLIRDDGSTQSVDLERYFATGNTTYNPYLRDGDVVSVPAFNPYAQSVRVDGAVPFPGAYAYRPDDTVLDLLAIATGQRDLESVKRVHLTRPRHGAPADTMTLNVAALQSGEHAKVPLHPLDHLYVPAGRHPSGKATVEGWVMYPGTYPIDPDQTTVEDLLEKAGGLRADALERGAYVVRGPTKAERKRSKHRLAQIARKQGLPASSYPERYPRLSAQATTFQQTRLADLGFAERLYLTQELSQYRVPVNLSPSDAKQSEATHLQDGDRLVVPRDRQAVLVTGQVDRPGYITVQPDTDIETYIAQAGGRTNLAAQGYVIKAGTQRYIPLDEANVESGDTIFLNRQGGLAADPKVQDAALQNKQLNLQEKQLNLQEEQSKRNMRFRIVQTALSAISTAVTVALLVVRTN